MSISPAKSHPHVRASELVARLARQPAVAWSLLFISSESQTHEKKVYPDFYYYNLHTPALTNSRLKLRSLR